MRSKAPLVLMEQIVMLLVFALAAAVCLQSFVKSDQLSEASAARDQAVVVAQNTAEMLKSTGSDGHTVAGVHIQYDADWQVTQATDSVQARYTLIANRVDTGVPGLAAANVAVHDNGNGKLLFELEVAWQESLTGGERQ